jgi:two-component system sensor histidine kinase KdpD
MFRIPTSLPRWLVRNRTGFAFFLVSFAVITGALVPFVEVGEIVYVIPLFLLITLISAALWGYGVGIAAAIVASLCVNFFFTEPQFTFNIEHPTIIAAVAVFFAVAMVGATMLGLIRRQALATQAKGVETQLLLDLSREVTAAATPADALHRICTAATRILGADLCQIITYRDSPSDGLPRGIITGARVRWSVIASFPGKPEDFAETFQSKDEESVAVEALRTRQTLAYNIAAPSRPGSDASPSRAEAVYVPIGSGDSTRGILKIVGTLSAFADETSLAVERARLADEALRAEALEKADEFKSAVLSSVSHDLRSPLTAIKTSVGSLRDHSISLGDEDKEAFLGIIESQTDRLAATVDSLLQMNRLETGTIELKLEAVDSQTLLREVVAQTQNLTAGRQVNVQAPPDLLVRADHALMVQALGNLVENAAKYSTPGGGIRLTAERMAGSVVLSVADEGPGIAREDLPHLFQRFYRGKSTAGVRGTGLGLSIVKSMVELCGGKVTVWSTTSGTTFVITLPVVEEAGNHDRRAHSAR